MVGWLQVTFSPYELTRHDLLQTFAKFGDVSNLELDASPGVLWVQFSTSEAAVCMQELVNFTDNIRGCVFSFHVSPASSRISDEYRSLEIPSRSLTRNSVVVQGSRGMNLVDIYSQQQRLSEGEQAFYIIVHTKDMATLLYSCETGYFPVSEELRDELVEYYDRAVSSSHPLILVVYLDKQYIGYMYMVGTVVAFDDTVEIVPKEWTFACRVSWARIGPLTQELIISNVSLNESEKDILCLCPNGAKLEADLGRRLCSLLDEAGAVKVLPNRERVRTQQNPEICQNSMNNFGRSHIATNYNFGGNYASSHFGAQGIPNNRGNRMHSSVSYEMQ